MLHANVVDGVHRIEDAYTNWYLVEENGRLTVVDTGVPTSWKSFTGALGRLRRRPDDVEAIVLTHGHFDHLGFAERARSQLRVPVYVHEDDVPLTKHPRRYGHERARSYHVTLDPYRNSRGPQIVSRAATADSERALRSLDALAATGATTVLTGHGEPWREGVEAAVARAREAGVS